MSSDFYVKIQYHDGTVNKVDESTKAAVKKAVEMASDSVKNKEFLKNLDIHVASDFSNLPNNGSALNKHLKEKQSSLYSTKGVTTDDLERKEIFIQETAFFPDKVSNVFSFSPSFSADKEITQATMHELGHQFDYTGADKSLRAEHQKFVEKYYDRQFDEIEVSPSEGKILIEYMKNNGYSDKKEFKSAIQKDLKNLELNSSTRRKFGYFVAEFYNRGLDIVPNSDDVENADASRMEIFAQLFSYATGTDDGNKDDFIKLFPNTYNVVKKYINE